MCAQLLLTLQTHLKGSHSSIKRCLLSVHFWKAGLGIKFESHEYLVFVPRNEDLKRKKAVTAYELPGCVLVTVPHL